MMLPLFEGHDVASGGADSLDGVLFVQVPQIHDVTTLADEELPMDTTLDLFHRPDPNGLQGLMTQLPPVIIAHDNIQPQQPQKV